MDKAKQIDVPICTDYNSYHKLMFEHISEAINVCGNGLLNDLLNYYKNTFEVEMNSLINNKLEVLFNNNFVMLISKKYKDEMNNLYNLMTIYDKEKNDNLKHVICNNLTNCIIQEKIKNQAYNSIYSLYSDIDDLFDNVMKSNKSFVNYINTRGLILEHINKYISDFCLIIQYSTKYNFDLNRAIMKTKIDKDIIINHSFK